MKSASSKAGAGCVILFALPFAAIGTFALVMAARSYMAGEKPLQVFFLACFGIAFGLAGFGLIFAAIWGSKKVVRDEALKAQHPGAPWLWNAEWASRRIPDRSRAGTVMLWVFGILWNSIASPVLIFLPRELEKGNYAVLIALIFPIVGAGIIITAVRATLRALRFHRSTLHIDALPIPLGGTLRGRVEVPYAPLADADSVTVRLTAFLRYRSGKSTTERAVWQEEHELARGSIARMPDRVMIPIAIPIAADAPPTENYGQSEGTVWRLAIDAELPGIDYSAVFDVPVFRTSATPAPQTQTPAPHVPVAEPRQPESFVAKETVNGRELHFPPFRARRVAFTSLAIVLIWCGFVAAIATSDAPGCFILLFALFAIPLFLFTLDLFFGSSTVILGREQVIVRRRLFGMREHVIRRADIASVETKIGTSTSGSSPRSYYDVEVRTQDGKKVAAAKFIGHKREAEWLAAQIRGAVDSRA